MYSSQVLDHFEHPRNAGVLAGADAVAQCENPVCGDVLKLSVRIADGHLAEIRFQAQGCVPVIACGSALTELAKGRSLDEVKLIGKSHLLSVLGELPPASGHAADLAVETLAAALAHRGPAVPR